MQSTGKTMKNFKAVLDILRENISFKLGVMVTVTLFTCFVPGLWILGVQRLVDAYGDWQHSGGNLRENAGMLAAPLLLLAVLFLAKKLDQMFKIPIELSLQENIGNSLKVQLIRKGSRLPLVVRESAECQNQMEVCNVFVGEISRKANKVLLVFRSGIMMVSVAGAVSVLNPWILLALCVGTLPSFFSMVYAMNNAVRADQELGARNRVLSYYAGLMTGVAYAKELKAYRLYPVMIDRWAEESLYINRKRLLQEKKNAVGRLVGGICLSCGFTAAAIFLMRMIMDGSVSVGAYVAMFGAITSFSGALGDLIVSVTDIMTLFGRVRVFREFMELEEKTTVQGEKIAPESVGTDTRKESGDPERKSRPRESETEYSGTGYPGMEETCYRLQNVSFRYPGCTDYVLKDVSCEIRKGERVAVVGENGAGKSTLVKLMLNLYSRDSGEILFCGKPVAAYGEEIKDICDYFPQNFIRYQGSLRENVLLHNMSRHVQNSGISDDQIIRVLERVGLSGLLKETGYNLDIPLGKLFEDGRELSGGQWQRVALARALVGESEYIFLDEPTSALDPVSEIQVMEAFLETVAGRTAVIVSHRIGVARRCDKILVIERQRVAQFGTHAELMGHAGPYRKMVELQASLYQ